MMGGGGIFEVQGRPDLRTDSESNRIADGQHGVENFQAAKLADLSTV